MANDPIYLDYNATSPMAPEVVDAMVPALRDLWGNASSKHAYGARAKQALEAARERVAALIGAHPDEILFTSGGTESDNAALFGVTEASRERGRHLVISNVEHAAVELAAARLEAHGWEVTRSPVNRHGHVEVDAVVAAMRDDTALVSIMHGQNETGVLQPVKSIGAAAHERGIPFHCDAAQSVGKMPIDVDGLNVDLLTLAGHKFYGPKGVGALYVRRGTPYAPFLLGAGHEGGRRAGTENVPAAVGLGMACLLAGREFPERTQHLITLRDRLIERLRSVEPRAIIHGESVARLPNTVSIALAGVSAVDLAEQVKDVAIGSGAACHSGVAKPSAVLTAMGVDESTALSTVRICVGRPTSEADVDQAAERIARAAASLRGAAPSMG